MKFVNEMKFFSLLKRLFSVALSVAFCAALTVTVNAVPQTAAVSYVEGPNLLQNGDFSVGDVCNSETDTTKSIPGWSVQNQNDTLCIRENDVDGRYCETTVTGSYRNIVQDVALKAGVTYVLEGDFCDAESGAVRYARINSDNVGLKLNFDESAVWDGKTWNHLKQEFVLADNCTSLGFYTATVNNGNNTAAHKLKMKNLSVRKVTMAAGNLLVDGGFEEPSEITTEKKEAGGGWYKNGAANVNVESDASGNHWVKISDRETIYRMVRQSANLMAGHEYQLTFKYRLSDMKGGAEKADFQLYIDKGDGKPYKSEGTALTADSGFQTAAFRCSVQETGAYAVYIIDCSEELIAGCVELDDIVLTDITDPESFNYYEGFEEMETAPSITAPSSYDEGWFVDDTDAKKSERSLDTNKAKTGTRSLKKTGKASGGNTTLALYQKRLPQGSYRANVWSVRDGSNAIDFKLSAGYRDISQNWITTTPSVVNNPKGDTSWKNVSHDFYLPYGQCARLIFGPGWSTVDAWVDDFSIKALSLDYVETDGEAVRYTLQSMKEIIAELNEGISLPVIDKDIHLPSDGCYDTSIVWSGEGVHENVFAISGIAGWTELTAVVSKGSATDTFRMYVYIPNEGEAYGTASAMKANTFIPADHTYAGNTAKIVIPVSNAAEFNGIVIVAQYENVNGAKVLKDVDLLDGSSIIKEDGYIRADVKYENADYDMSVMVFNNINDIVPLCSAKTVIQEG